MAFMKPKARASANKKTTSIPTRNADPTSAAGRGIAKSAKRSTRYNKAALYRAKGEKII